jgi:hypothetical protein
MTETDWAIKNLELAGFFGKDSDYDGMIGEAVKELLLVLQKQGHSGASYGQTLRVFFEVAKGRSLTRQHWQERFDEFNKLSQSHGGGPISEIEYIRLGYPKPKADQ